MRYRAGGDRWVGGDGGAPDAGPRPGRSSLVRGTWVHGLSAGAGDDAAAVLGTRHAHRPAAPVPVWPARLPGGDGAVFLRQESAVPADGAGYSGAGRRRLAERLQCADSLDLSGTPARPRSWNRQCRRVELDRAGTDIGRPGAVGGELAVDLRRRGAAGIAVAAARPACAA